MIVIITTFTIFFIFTFLTANVTRRTIAVKQYTPQPKCLGLICILLPVLSDSEQVLNFLCLHFILRIMRRIVPTPGRCCDHCVLARGSLYPCPCTGSALRSACPAHSKHYRRDSGLGSVNAVSLILWNSSTKPTGPLLHSEAG